MDFITHSGLIPRGNRGSLWTVNGGYETLKSYETILEDELDDRGLPTRALEFDIMEEHYEFLKTLPVYLEYPELKTDDGRHLVVSHSSVNRVWKMRDDDLYKEQFKKTAMWTRDFSRMRSNLEIYNVFGHTPQEASPIRSFLRGLR